MREYVSDNVWLMQEDCIEAMKKIPSGSVDLVLTDPPYGTTRNKWDSIIPLDQMWEQLWRITKPNASICLFAQTPFDKVLGASMIKCLKYEWIWQKNKGTGHLNAKKMPMKNHENILVFYKKTPTYNSQKTKGHKKSNNATSAEGSSNYNGQKSVVYEPSTERHPLSVLPVPVINNDGTGEDRMHPTQKPVPLMEHFVLTYTNEGDVVLDFAQGSCPVGKACIKHDRDYIGIDNGQCEKKGHKYEGRDWIDVVKEELIKC